MYKLFIVDDESSVRSGLRECVDWSAFGIDVAGEAEDGEMALQALLAARDVRIVLTDVRMPHMDGITLAQRLAEKEHPAKLVFVSGYGDLDYLKMAIRLEAVDYLLKPVRMHELNELIGRVVRKLDEEEADRDRLNGLRIKLNQSIPLLRERHLATLVLDGAGDAALLHDRFEFLGIRLPVDPIRLGVFGIRIDDYAQVFGAVPEKERQLRSFALVNVCEDIMNDRYAGHAFELRPGEYAGLLQLASDSDEDGLFAVLDRIKEQVNRLLRFHITIGVGPTAERWDALPDAYRLAAQAAEHKWYMGKNNIITMDALADAAPGAPSRLDNGELKDIAVLLKSPSWDAVRRAAETLLSDGKRTGEIVRTRISFARLLAVCSELRLELQLPVGRLEPSELRLWDAISSSETIDELRIAALTHLKLVHDEVGEKRDRKTHNIVAQIRRFIEEHYAEELTNARIASSVYLTTTYVCLLFKQETGMTLNECVIETRIAQAKRLLADPANKLYDVCYAVGYKDPGYFGKLFKKMTGYTPGEYRERGL